MNNMQKGPKDIFENDLEFNWNYNFFYKEIT